MSVSAQDHEPTDAERFGLHLMNLAQALGMPYSAPSHVLLDRVRELRAQPAVVSLARKPIVIVFDGPPGPEAGRFVEVEDEAGHSIRVGDWSPYAHRNAHAGTVTKNWWQLRIEHLPLKES